MSGRRRSLSRLVWRFHDRVADGPDGPTRAAPLRVGCCRETGTGAVTASWSSGGLPEESGSATTTPSARPRRSQPSGGRSGSVSASSWSSRTRRHPSPPVRTNSGSTNLNGVLVAVDGSSARGVPVAVVAVVGRRVVVDPRLPVVSRVVLRPLRQVHRLLRALRDARLIRDHSRSTRRDAAVRRSSAAGDRTTVRVRDTRVPRGWCRHRSWSRCHRLPARHPSCSRHQWCRRRGPRWPERRSSTSPSRPRFRSAAHSSLRRWPCRRSRPRSPTACRDR